MARRYPTSPFYKMVDAVGWAAFDGPVEVLSKDVAGISVKDSYLKDSSALPRVLAHDGWADHNEKQMIAGDGGTWRGENVSRPVSTVNAARNMRVVHSFMTGLNVPPPCARAF